MFVDLALSPTSLIDQRPHHHHCSSICFSFANGCFQVCSHRSSPLTNTLSNDPMQSIYQLVGQHVSVIVPNELAKMDDHANIFSLSLDSFHRLPEFDYKFRSTNFRYLLFMVCDRKHLQFVRRKLGYFCPLVFSICLLRCCTPSTT